MDFHFTEYQATVESAVVAMADRFRAVPSHQPAFHIYGDALDAEIERAGFHAVMQDSDLAGATAACVVMEFARLPPCVEIMASTFIHPVFCPDAPRPLALIEDPARAVRFLPQAKSALIVQGDGISLVRLQDGDVTPVESMLAYPYGHLSKAAVARIEPVKGDADELRRLWQVGIASEIHGALQSALNATSEYVTQRHQFGKPLGTLQAIQHRLSEVAVATHAIKWLTYRAASSGSAEDAAIACAYAQDAARQSAYDLHQFSGANGLTLEYVLHFWTYRLKALLSELGGAGTQSLRAADLAWGTA